MQRYVLAAEGGIELALSMYQWNTDLSGAMFCLVQHTEVILRNSLAAQMHQLRIAHGDPTGRWLWSDTDAWFSPWWQPEMLKQLGQAERRVSKSPSMSEGRIIAEMSFGFWRYLLTSHYEASLWTPALRHAFKPGLARSDVYAVLEGLNI